MNRRIALLGLSGVGKSTLIAKVAERAPLLHLQASALIKAEQAYRLQRPDSSEALRTGAVIDNQALMITAFRREADMTPLPIVFDGHSVIDGSGGLVEIPPSVFAALDFDAICFMTADPLVIIERRAADTGRQRPYRDANTLAEHQYIAQAAAQRIAYEIGLPFQLIDDGHLAGLSELIDPHDKKANSCTN